MFSEAHNEAEGTTSFNSGIHVSCPIFFDQGESNTPLCYCIEVRRSPLLRPFPGHGNFVSSYKLLNCGFSNHEIISRNSIAQNTKDDVPSIEKSSVLKGTGDYDREKFSPDFGTKIHGPVAYSLVIHPPIVIENLLPETARFELMHASRRQVLWWGILSPGEIKPVHTVGLDTPLLLLMNLGYCRTPIGEGALVNHGASKRARLIGWSNINKATVQNTGVAKATNFASFADSPEDRGRKQLEKLGSPQIQSSKHVGNTSVSAYKPSGLGLHTLTESVDAGNGKEGDLLFSEDDIATETMVVDSLGQKLLM